MNQTKTEVEKLQEWIDTNQVINFHVDLNKEAIHGNGKSLEDICLEINNMMVRIESGDCELVEFKDY
jgi:hypothetical protein